MRVDVVIHHTPGGLQSTVFINGVCVPHHCFDYTTTRRPAPPAVLPEAAEPAGRSGPASADRAPGVVPNTIVERRSRT